MKSELKKEGSCKRILSITIEPGEVARKFDEVYNDFGRTARVPGYRPGKVPRDLLEKHYAAEAKTEVIKRSIPEFYQAGLKTHQLRPVALPEIGNVAFKPAGSLEFTAELEVRPEIKLKKYKRLKVAQKTRTVTAEDIDNSLKRLQELKVSRNTAISQTAAARPNLSPPDDEFARECGCENLAQLKEKIGAQLARQFEADSRRDLEMQVINQLLENNSFSLPETLVKSESAHLLERLKANLRAGGTTEKEISEKTSELNNHSQAQAESEVKLYFIFDEIAQLENIRVAQADLDAELQLTAGLLKKTKEQIAESLRQQNRWDDFLLNLRDRKIINFLIENAEIERS